MLKNGLLITEGDLYDYVQRITDKITKASGVATKRKLYIVRKNSPNAFNMGDNSIFIHLGLIYRMNNEAELAYVIGH